MNRTSTIGLEDLARKRPVHPFPARMAPEVAWQVLQQSDGRSFRVLDPMVGSGTTLVVAKALGHSAVGIDSDPLAVILARAWCADIRPGTVQDRAALVHERAARRWRHMRGSAAFPMSADDETRAFLRYWFDDRNRRQLAALSEEIARVGNAQVRALLWCAFSRLIIVKSIGVSLAMDVAHSRPHRVYDKAPISAIDHFAAAMRRVVSSAPFLRVRGKHAPSTVRRGDARRLRLEDRSIDIVITSPPYLNGIDYLRGNKFSLVWMGHNVSALRGIRARNVGTEVSRVDRKPNAVIDKIVDKMSGQVALSARTRGMLTKYVFDMSDIMSEIARVLKRNGRAVFVVGNSTIRGTFVRNSAAIERLAAENGLRTISRRRRKLADRHRYLPPPSHRKAGEELGRRLREEVVLCFSRN